MNKTLKQTANEDLRVLQARDELVLDTENLLEHLWENDEGAARIVERLFKTAFPDQG